MRGRLVARGCSYMEQHKVCPGCGVETPLSGFSPRDSRVSWGKCKACNRKYVREYYERYPEKKRDVNRRSHLKSTYDMTVEQYDEMLAAQGGGCGSCGGQETRLHQNGRLRSMAVDHDHKTGRVRGILCQRCNITLGLCEEKPEVLMQVIKYITAITDNPERAAVLAETFELAL